MYPISSIDKISMMGTKHRNILVVDLAQSYHIATYNKETNTFKDFNTQKLIEDPIMWDYLPTFDSVCFEREVNAL